MKGHKFDIQDSHVFLDYRDPDTLEIDIVLRNYQIGDSRFTLQLTRSDLEELLKGLDQ